MLQAQLNIGFSNERGFYENPFYLAVNKGSNVILKYTLDGSAPTLSGNTLPDSILINTTTPVRILAFNNTDTVSFAHTYIFLDDVINQSNNDIVSKGYPLLWGSGTSKFDTATIINQVADYEMEPSFSSSPEGIAKLKNGLKQIPTISITTDKNNLFHATSGMYTNPLESDSLFEKPIAIEMFDGDGTAFQTTAGLKISGASTRYYDFYKHAFRIVFKKKYGDGKLDYPVYGNDGAFNHNSLVLRMIGHCSPHDWSDKRREISQFQKDKFTRTLHRKMGNLSPNSKFIHLYLNGIYWGLYDLTERPDADFHAEYLGGDEEDYDVIKQLEVKNGDSIAYYRMIEIANDSPSGRVETQEQFDSLNYYLDMPSFADYVLLNHFIINGDWNENNWWAGRRNKAGEKFHFYVWDAEWAFFDPIYQSYVISFQTANHPAGLHKDLANYREYQVIFGDRVQCNCMEEDGALYDVRADFIAMEASINDASLAELARWGDVRGTQIDYDDNIVRTRNVITNDIIPFQTDKILEFYTRTAFSLFPKIEAVGFNNLGGVVPNGFTLELTNPNSTGKIYYTTDGTDPRLPGGGLHPDAIEYTSPIVVNDYKLIKARVYSPGNNNPQYVWSAMCPRQFFTAQDYNVVINEIHYNPLESLDGLVDGDEYEFIELKNIGTNPIDLSNAYFGYGIDYQFPIGTTLEPGDFWVLAENSVEFNNRYNIAPHGEYSGKLSNSGEILVLNDPNGAMIDSIKYNDKSPWPKKPDGDGPSLSLMPNYISTNEAYSSWSSSLGYTPNEENIFCQPVDFNVDLTGIDCDIDANAKISVSPSGGIGPYNYLWEDGETLNTVSNIIPKKYEVTVTDTQGCEYDESIVVNDSYFNPDLELHFNISIPTGLYKTSNTITAKGRINANSNVTFKSGEITLLQGFEASKFADLYIDIDPCQ